MTISRREQQQNNRLIAINMLDNGISVEKVAATFKTTVRSVNWRSCILSHFSNDTILLIS